MSSARDRIAERVKNAYAAGYNDGRKGMQLDRMDEVAEAETERILEIVLLALFTDADGDMEKSWSAAFGADDGR